MTRLPVMNRLGAWIGDRFVGRCGKRPPGKKAREAWGPRTPDDSIAMNARAPFANFCAWDPDVHPGEIIRVDSRTGIAYQYVYTGQTLDTDELSPWRRGVIR